jgi:hypothetical protein
MKNFGKSSIGSEGKEHENAGLACLLADICGVPCADEMDSSRCGHSDLNVAILQR